MKKDLNQLLANITNINVQISNLINTATDPRSMSLSMFEEGETAKVKPEICEEVHSSLFTVLYKNLN